VPGEKREGCATDEGQDDADRSNDHAAYAHGAKVVEVCLQAHAEQQNDDPKLREAFEKLILLDQSDAVRAQHRAGNELADQCGAAESNCELGGDLCGDEDDGYL
jgi:hypothetical protein